jgi:hypothetical protein
VIKLSRISTESYLFKSHRLHHEAYRHDVPCAAIIKINNAPDYFYLEIGSERVLSG